MALDHHHDPSSAEWTDIRARRVPCLDDHEMFLLNANRYIDLCDEPFLHHGIFEGLRDLGIARIGWNDEALHETWLFDFKPKYWEDK